MAAIGFLHQVAALSAVLVVMGIGSGLVSVHLQAWFQTRVEPALLGRNLSLTLSAFAIETNTNNATYSTSIGDVELKTAWTDPDFDPSLPALYYARVIQIPTPRWSTYDAFRFGIPIPQGAPATTQERAYTSPIWYTP